MLGKMKGLLLLTIEMRLVRGNQKVFSVHDDLLAFPQYDVVFSDEYVSDVEAESRVAFEDSRLSSRVEPTASSISTLDGRAPGVVLSTRKDGIKGGENQPQEATERYHTLVYESKSYLCSIPLAVDSGPTDKTADDIARKNEEKELVRATARGGELLKDMEGHCMYFVSGWWSYSFCYNKEVKQFHALPPGRSGVPNYPPVEDKGVPAYILGRFADRQPLKHLESQKTSVKSPERVFDTATSIQVKGEMRYMVQNLTGGTTCDLTGKPRKIEVQFHCHPQSSDRIGWIKETATCAYLMVIYTPRLCNDVAFLPPKESQAQHIVCKEVVIEAEVDKFLARRVAEPAQKLIPDTSKDPARPIVGGIIVGGMEQVGQEGKRINPPKPVERTEQQGKVIAKWDPNQFEGKIQKYSDSDLRQMNLDPAAVNDMREELHKSAAGRAWKLEIVEAGRGIYELQGIVEEDDDATVGDESFERYDMPGNLEPQEDDYNPGDDEAEGGSEEVFTDEL